MRGLVVPKRSEDFTADPVELFFDLAFVYAFSQLVSHLVHHPTWAGAAEAGLLFLILWLAWSTFTWTANAVSGNGREVRLVFLIGTAISVPMGASITTAFGSGGGTFAICASVIVLLAIGLQMWSMSSLEGAEAELRSVVRYSLPNIAAMALLIIGGFLDEGPRRVLWALFVVVILIAIQFAKQGDWVVRPGHFAERHGLIIIIALGEIVVAIGISVVNSLGDSEGLPNQTLLGLIAAGILAGILWWGYFDRVQPALEHYAEGLQGENKAPFMANAYTQTHIPIVGGIIVTAAAVEEILLHPKDPAHTEFLVMFAGGLALFFGGIALAAFITFRVIARERLVAIAAIVAVTALAASWDGVMLLLVVDAILLVSLVAEHFRIEVGND